MTFMLRYHPKEETLHFFVSLFSFFIVAAIGGTFSDGKEGTASIQHGGELGLFYYLASFLVAGCGCFLAHCCAGDQCREEFSRYASASVASWVATCLTLTSLAEVTDKKSTPELVFLILFLLCLGVGVAVYFLGKYVTDRHYYNNNNNNHEQSASQKMQSAGIAAGHMVVYGATTLCSLEVGHFASPSLGWPIWTYYVLTVVAGTLGGAILNYSDPESYPRFILAVWPVSATGALFTMALYLEHVTVAYTGIMMIVGAFGGLVAGLPVYCLVKKCLRTTSYRPIPAEPVVVETVRRRTG